MQESRRQGFASPVRGFSNDYQPTISTPHHIQSSQVQGFPSNSRVHTSVQPSNIPITYTHASMPVQQSAYHTSQYSTNNPVPNRNIVYHQASPPLRDTVVNEPIVQKRVVHVQDEVHHNYPVQPHYPDQRESRRYYRRHEQGYKPKKKSSICNPCCLSLLGLLLLAGLITGAVFLIKAIQDGAGEREQPEKQTIEYEGSRRIIDDGVNGDAEEDGEYEDEKNGTPQEQQEALSPEVIDIDQNPNPVNHTINEQITDTSPFSQDKDVDIEDLDDNDGITIIPNDDRNQPDSPSSTQQNDQYPSTDSFSMAPTVVKPIQGNSNPIYSRNDSPAYFSNDSPAQSTSSSNIIQNQELFSQNSDSFSIAPTVVRPEAAHLRVVNYNEEQIAPLSIRPELISQQQVRLNQQLKEKAEEANIGKDNVIRVRPSFVIQDPISDTENSSTERQDNEVDQSESKEKQRKKGTYKAEATQKAENPFQQKLPQIMFQYPPNFNKANSD